MDISKGSKRLSLAEQIDRLADLDDDQLIQLVDEINEDERAAVGFRWHAPSTQAQQDHHLQMYREFVKGFQRHELEIPEDDIDLYAFPSDHERLSKLLRLFLVFVFKKARPRARASGQRIEYQSLAGYRDSLMFWIPRIYESRGGTAPPRSKVFRQTTEAMRSIYAQYADPDKKPMEKTFLGLHELRQLIDYEMYNNRCIENSEQHQVAWCMARITAIRPGSITVTGKFGRSQPLRWKDVMFQCGDQEGKFGVTITIDTIIKRPQDPEVKVAQSQRQLKCFIRAPEPDNIVFSVPHRLLVIALRRGILEGISTIDQLMNTPLQYIRIKAENQNDPLFYQSVPKGTALDPPNPLTARKLSAYLADRGKALGYSSRITFYSLRRRAATDMVRRIGLDATRALMGHAPETRTLEEHYLNTAATLDLTAVSLEQQIGSGGHSSQLVNDWADLATTKLGKDRLKETEGRALAAMTAKLIQLDPDCPMNPNAAELKAYRKKIRRIARKALLDGQHELQMKQMTSEEFRARQAAAKAHELMGESDEQGEDEGDVDFEDIRAAEDEDAEEDIEDAYTRDTEISGVMTFQVDHDIDAEVGVEGPSKELPYKFIATSFMETIMENTLTNYATWSERDMTCPLCEEDETVGPEQKAKQWSEAGKLEEHILSTYHSAFAMWKRRARNNHDQDPEQRWRCPYCGEKSRNYADLGKVIRHVKGSTVERHGEAHERAKAEDGWFDDDFEGQPAPSWVARRSSIGSRTFEKAGFDVYQEPELLAPEPHPTLPDVVLGHFTSNDIPEHLRGLVVEGLPTWTTIPPHLEGVVHEVDRPTMVSIPPHMRRVIVETDAPWEAYQEKKEGK